MDSGHLLNLTLLKRACTISPRRQSSPGRYSFSRAIFCRRVAVLTAGVMASLCGITYYLAAQTAARGPRSGNVATPLWTVAHPGYRINDSRFVSVESNYAVHVTSFHASAVTGFPLDSESWLLSEGTESPYWSAWRHSKLRQSVRRLTEHAFGLPGLPILIISYGDPDASELDAVTDAPLRCGLVIDASFGRASLRPAILRVHAAGTLSLCLLSLLLATILDKLYQFFRPTLSPSGCTGCNYPLANNMHICPECGKPALDKGV